MEVIKITIAICILCFIFYFVAFVFYIAGEIDDLSIMLRGFDFMAIR